MLYLAYLASSCLDRDIQGEDIVSHFSVEYSLYALIEKRLFRLRFVEVKAKIDFIT